MSNIILQNLTTDEFETLLKALIRTEIQTMNTELQRIMGEDDLISSGTASRLLGVCSKVFRHHVKEGHFTIYNHLKERRFSRGEILDYRNHRKVAKRKNW